MRRLLAAAALGLGLLSAGGIVGTASAAPQRGAAAGLAAGEEWAISPVQYLPDHYRHGYRGHGYHRPHLAPPPPRHWHRYGPPPGYRGHPWSHRPDRHPRGEHQYGWRR